MLRSCLAVMACCAIGACGSGDGGATKSSQTARSTASTPASQPATSTAADSADAATAIPADLTGDEREAGKVALRYIRAVVKRDWDTVCTTRSPSDRAVLARAAGSCQRAMAAAFKGKPVEIFDRIRVGDVRLRGERAGVDLVQPGQTKPALTLAAVRQRTGRWLLEDLPARETP